MSPSLMPTEDLGKAIEDSYPELARVADAATAPVYLVGGAVRDLLLGRGRADIDLVVVGDAARARRRARGRVDRARAVRDRQGAFSTATGSTSPPRRSESYPEPGALPVVEPAAEIGADLSRRDFTINAMAVPLQGAPDLIDPHGGRADLEVGPDPRPPSGLLRRRPDQGAARRPLRGPLRLRARARDRGADPRDRPRHRLHRPPARRSDANRGRARGPARPRPPRRVGPDRAASRRARAGRRASRRCCPTPPWQGFAPRARLDPRRRARPDGGRRGARRPGARSSLGGRRGDGRPRSDRARRSHGRWAPSGWTGTCSTGAMSALEIDGADLIDGRSARGTGGWARAEGGAAAKARRRRLRPRSRARDRARGGEEGRWSGVTRAASNGWRRTCRAAGSPSRPGSEASATGPTKASTSAT